ncbi:polysialyltransferase family glycosyltransferase [Oxalobacteraceae bacterium R-40]|uniref:Polysialyltransferase family glycosyltransferase n=1 Tax=Keguizhuia sedimenti TaxID=3064264 RepID=A0ABU1BR75_9BURK|nr:polysialyltransferase family glycosyltransferase [Oxalobacteraceae bacterium R-40]
MSRSERVALYFVASPLQYLAAKRIAENFEQGARQVLVWYKPGLMSIVKAEEWDACSYLPWPRLEPLPGLFGRHRRLRENIRLVAALVGSCETLVIHSAVFDTEAINYFLHALPKACGASHMHARILPDGLISIRRYPLSLGKRILQHTRKMRRMFAPELKYRCFSGDRIGSDAPFCDRIYVLPGLPNEYPAEKAALLPPLVKAVTVLRAKDISEKCALVVGQPLVDTGLLKESDMHALSEEISKWLVDHGIKKVHYKAHPKDPRHELRRPDYQLVAPADALETYLASHYYDAVIGVRSSALLFARQIYPPAVEVVAFGWDRINFKSRQEQEDMRNVFDSCGVRFA